MAVRDLLLSECALRLTRGDQQRSFKGIVWHARVHEEREQWLVELHAVPALQLLSQRSRSRIFQNKTIPEVFEQVYSEALGSQQRTIQNDLQASYETREYLVQYQESELAFLTRLAEEEGFWWYFDHEGDREVLVLSDTMSGLPRTREAQDGRVEHVTTTSGAHDRELAWGLHHTQRVGATDVVVAGYDWTHPTLPIRHELADRGSGNVRLEVYDHTDAVESTRFNGEQYEHHTSTQQAQIRAELLDLARESWAMGSSVLTAAPGRTIEVYNASDPELDQRYLILSSTTHTVARARGGVGAEGSLSNELTLVPTAKTYRPPRRTPRPVVGTETAVVVGASGDEIHTDVHGRVRVHFAWDREHAASAEDCRCWLRVAQSWAGPGFGTFFLPRVGMEVLVTFLGGNPDRPLVTGCTYNGDNRAGVELDAHKTQSLIRTKSSPDASETPGFNELRFEDEKGAEFIYVHAEKDYNEEVEHNHSTHVKVDQSNTVDHDQNELIGHDQWLAVRGKRNALVEQDETLEVQGDRSRLVQGYEKVEIQGGRKVKIQGGEGDVYRLVGDRDSRVRGNESAVVTEGRETWVENADDVLHVGGHRIELIGCAKRIQTEEEFSINAHRTERFQMSTQGYWESGKLIQIASGASEVNVKNDGNISADAATKIAFSVGENCRIEVTPETIRLTAGASSIELGPNGVTVSGPTVTSSAQTVNEVTGLLVKLN